jgi:hypothetical protein
MGFLRSGTKATNPPNYVGVAIQTSSEGMIVPVIYGRNQIAPNLVWADNFQRFASGGGKKGGGGGKGGGKGSQNYTYTAGVILAACEGPVSYGSIWVDGTTQTTFSALNLVAYTGTFSQTPFSCISTVPGFVPIAYRGIAYLATNNYDLGSSATVPQHNFEIIGFFDSTSSPNYPDVNAATIIYDICTSTRYGLAIPPALIGDMTLYATYCTALNLLLSPALNQEEQAISILQRWSQLTNSWIFWSENQMKFVPLGDTEITANGVTFVPVNTVRYDLTWDDFVTKKNESPVTCVRSEPSAAYNWTRINALDRLNQYSTATVEYKDQTSIDKYGLFQANEIQANEVCDRGIAGVMVGLIGARALYIRNTYKFTLGYNFVLLEPGDIVSLTDPALGLVAYPVRIQTVSENDTGELAVEAEECPSGVGVGIVMASQPAGGIGTPALNVAPGPVNNAPLIFEPPASVTVGVPQVWIGASGGPWWGGATVYLSVDDVTYAPFGQVTAATPQGVLLAALAANADPDTTDTLSVDLIESLSVLSATVTHADADAGRSLAMVGTELLAYGAVAVNGHDAYSSDLTYLRRGFYDTTIAAHAIGDPFWSVVPAHLLQITLPAAYVGVTIYAKLVSFNIFGAASEDISAVTRYSYTPTGVVYTINPPSGIALAASRTTQADGTTVLAMTATWTASTGPALGRYEVQFSADGGTTWPVDQSLGASALSYALIPAVAATSYVARVRAISQNGLAISAWDTSAAVNSGALVAAVPATPSGLVVTPIVGGFTMAWTASTDLTIRSYQAWAAPGASQPFSGASLLGSVAAPATFLTVTGETPSALSVFLVAVNAAGSSAPAG